MSQNPSDLAAKKLRFSSASKILIPNSTRENISEANSMAPLLN